MKKSYFLLFLFVFAIFLICPQEVEAKTRCKYHWIDPLHEGQTEDSSGNPITTEADFILETEDDDNKLTRVISPFTRKPAVFANGEGLKLNDDGTCPNISVYDQYTTLRFKIYKSKKSCQSAFFNLKDRCSDDLEGVVVSTDTSASDVTGSNIQYKLLESSDNSCKYQRINVDDNLTSNVTINKKNNKNVSGTCDMFLATSCSLEIDVKNDFYDSEDNFFCPTYIYAYREAYGKDANSYIVNIIDTGGDSDEDRSNYNDDATRQWEELGNQVTLDDFNNSVDCDDIFGQEEGELGWLLNLILGYIRVIGPILVVLLSAIDFIKAVVGTDEKAMKEAQSKLVIRLICAVGLFLVPTLVQVLLSFINQTACSLS